MGLFQQFPFTNFHELNLDWLIKTVKDLGEHAVLSVNGETGDVILYKSENIVFPEVTANTWRMVRVADGHTAGIMFQNGLLYVMYDNAAERVYTVDHPPAYPVTSVNGETGAVETYKTAYNRLPAVSEQNTNFYRQIDKDGSPADVGIQVDKNKIERMNGSNRYMVYDAGNTPNIVTSVNGESGPVIIAIPFADVETDNIMFQDAASGHSWSLGRETLDGVASIQLETTANGAEAYLRFFTETEPPVSFVRKLLTVDDIPSSSGVVSINGMTGVVTLYGTNIMIESGSSDSIKTVVDDLKDDLAIIENTDTATHNIPKGHFVCWKSLLYIATTNISISDTLSVSNLSRVNNGGLNDIQEHIFYFPGDEISDDASQVISAIVTTNGTEIYLNIPVSKNLEYVNTPVVTRLKAGCRIPDGGYLNANNYDYLANATNITATLDKHGGTIRLVLINSNSWNSSVPNNTPMVATVSYTITLN